jgi:hypothetical protein
MVAKQVEHAEAIMVQVQAIKPAPDVGSAIDIMEATLATAGVVLQGPTPKNPEAKNKAAGKLLRLPSLIHMAITYAIDMTTATESSIGKVSSIMQALVPGNVVALYSTHHSFLRISGTGANFGSGTRNMDELPLAWDFERFLVVDAGNGKISLFSPSHRMFLGCLNGCLTVNGYPIVSLDVLPRAHEIFQINKNGTSAYFSLFCEIEGKHGQLDGQTLFQVVQIQGFSPGSNNF